MDKLDQAQVAISFHYLAESLLSYFSKLDEGNGSISTLFEMGEDQYLSELYPYAEAIESAWENRGQDRESPGVFVYEISDDLAPKLFIEMIDGGEGCCDPHPSVKQWKNNIQTVVNMWCEGIIDSTAPLLPQISRWELTLLRSIAVKQRDRTVERCLEELQKRGYKNIHLKDTASQMLTEICIGDHVYAAIDTRIIGPEVITTTRVRGLPDDD